MKTYFEIVENTNYRQLSTNQKEEIQNRQTALVLRWQDEANELRKAEIFDELYASLIGLIKGTAYRKARESFSVEQEDFEGLLNLVLVETLIAFDRTMQKPFQPVYMMNVNNAIKMMYRQKGYDVHDTSTFYSGDSEEFKAMQDHILVERDFSNDAVIYSLVEDLTDKLFGTDERKKTIAIMHTQGFKREQVMKAVEVEGELLETAKKRYHRTVNQFKKYCAEVMQVN